MTSLIALITMIVFLVSAIIIAIVNSGGYDGTMSHFMETVSAIAMVLCCVVTVALTKGLL